MTSQTPIEVKVAVQEREAQKILPQLFRMMIGNGGFRLDTDSMSLSDPRDRETLSWLSRLVAKFVIEEKELWEPQIMGFLALTAEKSSRADHLDHLLLNLREKAADEEVTVEELKSVIATYRTPMEHYYDTRKAQEELMQVLRDNRAKLTEEEENQASGE